MLEIYFTRPRSFNLLSWLIMKTQGTNYSHVAIRAGGYVYESHWPFSRKVALDAFKQDNIIVLSKMISFDKNDGTRIKKFLESQLGRIYSVSQIFAILFEVLKLPFKLKYADNNHTRLVCTEMIYLFYQEFMSGEYNHDSDMVDLIEIYSIVILDKRVWEGAKKHDFSNFIL